MRSVVPHRRGVVIATVALLAAAACTDDDPATAPTTTVVATTTTVPAVERPVDDVLRIGVLLPVTGAGQELGLAMLEAVRTAQADINAAGGVNGSQVVITNEDEGRDAASASGAMQTLVDDGVDAIIGPASSTVALSALDIPIDNEIVTCSPTATALALDEYPSRSLFFRAIPSDSLQMVAAARVAQITGARTLAVIALDDPYGRGLADALEDAARELGLEVVRRVDAEPDDEEFADEVARALADEPSVVVVLGDVDDGTRLLVALGEQLDGVDSVPAIVVNDGLRAPLSQQSLERIPTAVRSRITGVSPDATNDVEELAGPYAANAYDCAVLIALAAEQAGTDDPEAIAGQLAAVSTGGSPCQTFADCAARIERGLTIDYDGPSGATELSVTSGDPVRARFDRWGFDPETGRDVTTGTLVVER